MKRTGPTNEEMQKLISELRKLSLKENVAIWKRIAYDLEKPTRQRRVVNIYKIEKFSRDGETIIVPGKVLGVGTLNRKLNVAAFNFSQQAVDKINSVGGKVLAIYDVLKENPKGKNVRILG